MNLFSIKPGLLASAGLLAMVAASNPQLTSPAFAHSSVQGQQTDLTGLVQAVMPSVVSVGVEVEYVNGSHGLPQGLERFFGTPFSDALPEDGFRGGTRKGTGVGSGFLIDEEGHLVTNHHVIRDAKTISVTLHDGTSLDATLIGSDPQTDIALLKIEHDQPLIPVSFADSDAVEVGSPVMAVGNPFGLGGTVTSGIVSAKGRQIGSSVLSDYLQLDAPINKGNSGGPAFNMKGEVIGINTAIYSPHGGNVGIGFAIAANLAQEVIGDLKDDGEIDRGWLGVRIQKLNADLSEALGLDNTDGALVNDVITGSPADLAGIKEGDLIVAFDEEAVQSPKDLAQLVFQAGKNDPETMLTILRDGEEVFLEVVLDKLEQEGEKLGSDQESHDGPRLGVSVASLDEAVRQKLKVDQDIEGAVIMAVEPGSPADRAGLRKHDILLEIDQTDISSAQDTVDKVKELADGGARNIALLIWRDGRKFYQTLLFGNEEKA